MIDLKAIRAAAEYDFSKDRLSMFNPRQIIALCDEIERLRKEGECLLSLDSAEKLLEEIERLRKDAEVSVAALQGLLATNVNQSSDEYMFARDAFKLADAMMKAREVRNKSIR